MAQLLDPNCGENFAVWADHVYFQAGNKGLYRIPCDGSSVAQPLDERAGYLVVPGDSYVYFKAGNKGLYRVPCDGSANAQQLYEYAGHLAVSDDGYVYFQAGNNGLYRVKCDGSTPAQPLDPNAGYLAVWENYVYFQAGDKGLYRVPCDGSAKAQPLDERAGYLVVPGDGYVYFQAGTEGLYRVKCDGSAPAQPLDENAGHLAVWDNYVYFQAGHKGLYRVPCDGSAKAEPLDESAGYLVVPGDGYVYFQAGNKGLYRVRCDGKSLAEPLDPNCGNLVASHGYIYFQGNPYQDALFRIGVAIPSAPSGLKMRVQNEYVVDTVLDDEIDAKYTAIEKLLDESNGDATNTWFINFTSGASTGAYPNAVAGRINYRVLAYINKLAATKANRLGTVVMDFPDDNGRTDLIDVVFNYNSTSPLAAPKWMASISDQKQLSEITIPGTHNSCTFNATSISKCQNLKLDEQLMAGIRYIDIRCRHYYDVFELHHGREYLHLNFDYVLTACEAFLKEHNKECIVMLVQNEYQPAGNVKTFEQVFNEYVQRYPDLFYLGNTIPTLSRVRGKVVVLRRFYISPGSNSNNMGIDITAWPDNTTFTWPF